ncbi:MAG: Gfo/Idh/MocA family oxidoreductase [Candidatus Pacebacteria bacterium]|nr:Gfo/Idh/MocA family oxidoreductase [Candidatus Paceibacterota bacterium]
MANQKPLKFAVIGCGMLARSQHIPNIAASDKADLYMCCDLDDDALAECRETHGAQTVTHDYKEAVHNTNVDAICLATTEKLRLPVIAEAVKAGKPVYCEKPLARSLEEMYEIQALVNEAGTPFCVGHNRRSSPAMLYAHNVFRKHMTDPQPCPWRFEREADKRPDVEGDGTASIVVRINDDWHSWKSWVFDPQQAPHGPMLFEMTHFTDMCNWFLASEPTEAVAVETSMLNHSVIVRYAGGELATLTMTGNGTFGYPKELYEMFGNAGTVVVDHMLEVRTAGVADTPPRKLFPMVNDRHPGVGTEGGLYGWLAKKNRACEEAAEAGDPSLIFTAEPDKGHAHAIDRFIDEIHGTGPVVCGVDAAVAATRVAFAAIRSAKEGRRVALSEI